MDSALARELWDGAAADWHRWVPALETWFAPGTDAMLEQARLRPGARVLDVAAGDGAQSLLAARRVGPSGRVLATDLSPRLLEFAAKAAEAEGLRNVETRPMDAQALEVPEGSFDAAISRMGVMLMPRPDLAVAGMRRALRDGGRASVLVGGAPEANAPFALAMRILRRRAGLPPPSLDEPGIFALGPPGRLARIFRDAGFREVEERAVPTGVGFGSTEEFLRFLEEGAPVFRPVLARIPQGERDAAWREIAAELATFEGLNGFRAPSELRVVAGTR